MTGICDSEEPTSKKGEFFFLNRRKHNSLPVAESSQINVAFLHPFESSENSYLQPGLSSGIFRRGHLTPVRPEALTR